jgi:membrane protein
MASDFKGRLKQIQEAVRAFFTEEDVATKDLKTVSGLRHFAWFGLQVGKSFLRNHCPIRASALAYTTLLALVPLLAVAVGVSTSLLKTKQGEEQIQFLVNQLVSTVAPQLDLDPQGSDAKPAGRTDAGGTGEGKGANRQKVAQEIIDYISAAEREAANHRTILALLQTSQTAQTPPPTLPA